MNKCVWSGNKMPYSKSGDHKWIESGHISGDEWYKVENSGAFANFSLSRRVFVLVKRLLEE